MCFIKLLNLQIIGIKMKEKDLCKNGDSACFKIKRSVSLCKYMLPLFSLRKVPNYT